MILDTRGRALLRHWHVGAPHTHRYALAIVYDAASRMRHRYTDDDNTTDTHDSLILEGGRYALTLLCAGATTCGTADARTYREVTCDMLTAYTRYLVPLECRTHIATEHRHR